MRNASRTSQKACTGTQILNSIPGSDAPEPAWETWAGQLFDQFRSDVQGGKLPQVSWIVAPAGYTEHPDWPSNYGAWYISQIFDILVSNPEVFSKTVFIVNYDENDGGFDHLVPPTPPQTAANGASTVSIENEIVTTATPTGPIGLGIRVPFLAISPWSKGGYVNSQLFDHTSVIRFIEQRFGVEESNISPWRRAVAGSFTAWRVMWRRVGTASRILRWVASSRSRADVMSGDSAEMMVPEEDYALWVKLANDPSQSEEARRQYRSQMEAYVHRKMREAFQSAAGRARAPPVSRGDGKGGSA